MERVREESLGDVLRKALEDNRLTAALDERKAVEMWKLMMGEGIAGRCVSVTMRAGVMTVRLPSAPLRSELSMRRSDMAAAINRRLGRRVVEDIRFVQ